MSAKREPKQLNGVRVCTQQLTSSMESASAEIALEPPDSGDFYESFAIPDGSGDIAILVGDVTGHGAHAASKANSIRDAAVAKLKTGASPLETVRAANAVSQTPDDRYATVFVARINGNTGDFRYANAGHEHPVVANTDRKDEQLETTGPPLGVVPAEMDLFEERTGHLDNESTLVVTTDGITEARKPNSPFPVFFGFDRFRSTIERIKKFSPGQIVQILISRVLSFTRSVLSDDIVLMAVRRHTTTKTYANERRTSSRKRGQRARITD